MVANSSNNLYIQDNLLRIKNNLVYRRKILERAAVDTEFQEECWIKSARDPVWWTSSFAWTYSPKDYPEHPNRPFVLYPYQEEVVNKFFKSIGKNDMLVEKSRDMGASWVCLLCFVHRFIFYPGQSFLMVSRKEEYVDKPGDPKSLFWKVDYIIERLPQWMTPSITSSKLHRYNEENGSTIDGESTNSDVATGDRRTAILLDEFAKVDDGHRVLKATRDATKSRIFNSTPEGAAGAYYDTREKIYATYPERIIRMHWTSHPEKAAGLYTWEFDSNGLRKIKILDKSYKFPINYQYIFDSDRTGNPKLRSPWYDEQCLRAASQQEIAQELDIDYVGSAWQWFQEQVIVRIAERDARSPSSIGEVSFGFGNKNKEDVFWSERADGDVKLWIPFTTENKPPPGEYAIACDVATGTCGEKSSNSVACIGDLKTRRKIGQLTTRTMMPYQFARYVVALCRLFGDAFLIWEANGPGNEFTKEILEIGYMNIFMRDDDTTIGSKKSKKPGWWSERTAKRILLSSYEKALIEGEYHNPCEEALMECLQFKKEPNGEIYHSRSKGNQDPGAEGDNHGDMVIADALLNRAFVDIKAYDKVETIDSITPVGSFAWRFKQFKKSQNYERLTYS